MLWHGSPDHKLVKFRSCIKTEKNIIKQSIISDVLLCHYEERVFKEI